MRPTCVILGLLTLMSGANADPLARPSVLESGLVGRWTGTLQYRDYQSDKLTSLPQTKEIQALADKATIIAISSFDDGPKSGTVYITSLSLFDPRSDAVQTTSFRRGETAEIGKSTAVTARYTDDTHWTVVYLQTGSDDDKPAEIRTTETRDGTKLTSVEEYRRPDDHSKVWNFRNQTILTLDKR